MASTIISKDDIKLVEAIIDNEIPRVQKLIAGWPNSRYSDLLNIIAATIISRHEEIELSPLASRSLMIAACKRGDVEELWNFAIQDDVPIHFDNFRPFLTACKHNNLSMVRDFRRFQYDDASGSHLIPTDMWKIGEEIARKNEGTETADWIAKYISDGTDDEEYESGEEDDSSDANSTSDNEYEQVRAMLKASKRQAEQEQSAMQE